MDHKSHSCIDINDAGEELRSELSARSRDVSAEIPECTRKISDLDQLKSVSKEEMSRAENAICSNADELMTQIQIQKQELLDELKIKQMYGLKQIAGAKHDVERHAAMLESFSLYADELRDKGSACDVRVRRRVY